MLHKRTLFEIEVKSLDMGLGGERIEDEKLCQTICKNFRDAYINRNIALLHDILSIYILQIKLFDLEDRTYCANTSILIKYEPSIKNLHFALEDGSNSNIRIDKLDDFKPFFDVFETGNPNLFFTTCAIYTNGWYKS